MSKTKWQREHPAEVAEQKRRWREANPDKVTAEKQRHYARYQEYYRKQSRKNYQRYMASPELREKLVQYRRRYRTKNLAKVRAWSREYARRRRAAIPLEHRRAVARIHELRKYGITPEQYAALLQAQHGACAICKTKNFGARRPAVDHSHTSNRVRGLLCTPCNTLIGRIEADSQRMKSAMKYLAHHS